MPSAPSAPAGFAGILYKLLTSDWAQSVLQSIFDKVLTQLPF
ncbi:MAG: DUF4244 domain-containing protein [Nocardioidaceae bacterium]